LFFILGTEDHRKVSWIDWKSICLGKEEYDILGVRRMREFNIALLDKWCWQMVVDKGGLWFRVLVARYGVDGDV
jgi:hypothetical protein